MVIDLDQSLATLESALDELARLQRERRGALSRVDTDALMQLADQEGEIGVELYRALAGCEPASDGTESTLALGNLGTALEELDESARQRVRKRIRSVAQTASAVQEELTGNYFITHRLYQHVTDLLDIMACAEGPALADRVEQPSAGAGRGVLLDDRA